MGKSDDENQLPNPPAEIKFNIFNLHKILLTKNIKLLLNKLIINFSEIF